MKTAIVVCSYCGGDVEKPKKEVTRSIKLGRKFFCNISCGAKHSNSGRKALSLEKACPECSTIFLSSTKKKAASFCSRTCASKNSQSLTPRRIEAAKESGRRNQRNLLTAGETLKRREASKYVELEKTLKGIQHEFEFSLGKYVFDLALPELSILVEFDGKYHTGRQLEIDRAKDTLAISQGLSVIRIKTDDTEVILACVLSELLDNARRRLVSN